MSTDYKFQGWLGHGPESAEGKMEWGTFEPKKWTEDDVDIKITHNGICGSDLHTLRSGWSPTPYPCCVGHEIVGHAVRVGNNVKHVKEGDRVGVGAQARSCGQPDCYECSRGLEPYCKRGYVGTYGDAYPGDEGKSYGGYADYNRTNGRFVFKIPDGLASEHAAPLLCAGATVYSPLRTNGCGPGKTVGVVGVGGLGHLAVMFAKAMGADKVVGLSRRANKRDEVLKLGAHEYIATEDDADWDTANARTLDLIICTVSNSNMPLNKYLNLLRVGGVFHNVGAPDGGLLPPISAFSLLFGGIKVGGSLIGSPGEITEMLQFCVDKGVKPWIEKRPLSEANQAIIDFEAGKPRYRYVLVNEKHAKEAASN